MEPSHSSLNQLVYAFPRGENEEIRFSIREYEKHFYVDLRLWFKPQNSRGEMRPTRKGLWIKPDEIAEMEKGIRELALAAPNLIPRAQAPRNAAPRGSYPAQTR